ncbi:MAG: putative ADP-ribosylglycohydrolase [Terrestrivirus sp.]|uniref:Putative ADP-ribosylglycohydrolase n=1 Tax=Terrestrivirus sp. TaxID=2487775 RepID=A0A3G4ZL22_9VIRU|nr:MAG: putative ADP-ribosylglycohydrolase [Terrestrivirus sp.]
MLRRGLQTNIRNLANTKNLLNVSNKLLGVVYGGYIGDAYGSRYEFESSDSVKKLLKNDNYQRFGLLGGGPFGLTPGQATDDSELALAMAHAIKNEKNNLYDPEIVAKNYIKWVNSNPFDIGNATRSAFDGAKKLDDIIKNVKKHNESSLSNGCLMRIWPLLYYYHNKSFSELIMAATNDCKMTHSEKECKIIVSVYCLILKKLIHIKENTESNKLAKQIIINILNENSNESHIVKETLQNVLNNSKKITLCDYTIELDNPGTYMGYIGVTFPIVIKEFIKTLDSNCDQNPNIYNGSEFINFMANVASYGGDTDTNCCIAGPLFGAFYGANCIPNVYVKQILSVNCDRYKEFPYGRLINFFN